MVVKVGNKPPAHQLLRRISAYKRLNGFVDVYSGTVHGEKLVM